MQYLSGLIFVILVVYSLATNSPPILLDENSIHLLESQIQNIEPSAENVNWRLPNHTLPDAYIVELTTNIHTGNKNFSGIVTIDLHVEETTSAIVMHARQLYNFEGTIQSLDEQNANPLKLKYNYNKVNEFLTWTADGTSFRRLTKWRLVIKYSGNLREDNSGFYISTYQDGTKTHYLATTQFESTDARHAFPCYDEPAKRADVTVIINHDSSYFTLSNMPIDSTKSTSSRTVFNTIKNTPTYLVAFIISDFKYDEIEFNSFRQRVYSRENAPDRQFALVSGMQMLELLNDYYSIKFPLPKLDLVAIPDFRAGAMENWGLTTYREEYLLYNKHKSTISTKINVAGTIAHEYCHQWFGNLVAIKWWTYVWLKEGFATLVEYTITNEVYPDWDFFQVFHVSAYNRALLSDSSTNSRPMTHYVEQPKQISAVYDSISYSKGGSILYMWQNALTETVFRRGLQNYLKNKQYNAAEEDDLFSAIQIAAGEENYPLPDTISNMMKSWTQQTNYPLLIVERDYEKKLFVIKQSTYFNDENISSNKTWYIPFNYATTSNADFRDTKATHFMLKSSQITVQDAQLQKDDWLILNKQSTGFYRINYDEQNWHLITEVLLTTPYKIHVRNRASLISDAYYLSSSKRLDYNIFLKLLTYLAKEDQYAPWNMGYSIFNALSTYLRGDAKYDQFQHFVSQLVNDIFDKIGVFDISGQPFLTPLLRNNIINTACMARAGNCLAIMTQKLSDSLQKNIEIDPNLESVTYCNGLKSADSATFNAVFNRLMLSDDQSKRTVLISNIACTENPTQLKFFLESSIDKTNQLRTQERIKLLNAAYTRSETGVEQSIEFLRNNWDVYNALDSGFTGENPAEADLLGLSAYVVSDKTANNVYALINTVRSKLPTNLETSVKSNIQKNMNWINKNRDPIMNWVLSYNEGKISSSASSFSASILVTLLALVYYFL